MKVISLLEKLFCKKVNLVIISLLFKFLIKLLKENEVIGSSFKLFLFSIHFAKPEFVFPRRETTLRLDRFSLYVCFLFLNITTSLLTNTFLQVMAREKEHEQRSWVKVDDTPCQNSKLKLNPSVKFLRHGGKKRDLQLQQNCNSTKKKYPSIYFTVTKGSEAGFVILVSLYIWR